METKRFTPVKLPGKLVNPINNSILRLEKMQQQNPAIFRKAVLWDGKRGSLHFGKGKGREMAEAVQKKSKELYENLEDAIQYVFGTSQHQGKFSSATFTTRSQTENRPELGMRNTVVRAVRGGLKQGLVAVQLCVLQVNNALCIKVFDLSKDVLKENKLPLSAKFQLEAWQSIITNLQRQFNRYVLHNQTSYMPPYINSGSNSIARLYEDVENLAPASPLIIQIATKRQLKKNYLAINVSKLGIRKYEPIV